MTLQLAVHIVIVQLPQIIGEPLVPDCQQTEESGLAQPPVTNGSPLTIGKQGVVLVDIEPGMPGRVRVDGLDWQARAGVPLAKGTRCQVTAVDGAVLIVVPVTADAAAV